jgi:hypothetical protein
MTDIIALRDADRRAVTSTAMTLSVDRSQATTAVPTRHRLES